MFLVFRGSQNLIHQTGAKRGLYADQEDSMLTGLKDGINLV